MGRTRTYCLAAAALVAATIAVPLTQAGASPTAMHYAQTNLVSDQPGKAQIMDPNLVNAWGLAAGPSTPIWVANNGTGKATLYTGHVNGSKVSTVPLVVPVPHGEITGQVFNGTNHFFLRPGMPALFLFSSEAGYITGWNPGTNALASVKMPGAVYKGLAMGSASSGVYLYATNFVQGRIDVFDQAFHLVHLSGDFTDPNLPANFEPFGIKNLGGKIYVTYAFRHGRDDQGAPGRGFVDVFDTTGHMLQRLVSRGALNSPWGLAMAPSNAFGVFAGDLLVGNFGDGHITAYDPMTGAMKGQLMRPNGTPVVIEGLWGLQFGNNVIGNGRSLLFSAGPDHENHGLFGALDATN
jgi:uncharacterized protein (TIGR03118 family)